MSDLAGRVIAAAVVGVLAVLSPQTSGSDLPGGKMGVELADASALVNARSAAEAVLRWEEARAADEPAAQLVEYLRSELCPVNSAVLNGAFDSGCAPSDRPITVPDCGPGITALQALWSRTRAATTDAFGPWQFVFGASCPQDTLPALSAEEFARLPLAPSRTQVQPSGGAVLVGYGIVVSADPAPQDLPTTVLGFPVTVHAVPTAYTWDFGDGSTPLRTTWAGAPYPSAPPYPERTHGSSPAGLLGWTYPDPGTFTLTLTTQWTGTYQINGSGPWLPVTGTATTTTTHHVIEVRTAHARLVQDTCQENPHGPGC